MVASQQQGRLVTPLGQQGKWWPQVYHHNREDPGAPLYQQVEQQIHALDRGKPYVRIGRQGSRVEEVLVQTSSSMVLQM